MNKRPQYIMWEWREDGTGTRTEVQAADDYAAIRHLINHAEQTGNQYQSYTITKGTEIILASIEQQKFTV